MANTYTQIYVHIVFAVQGRQALIPKDCKQELFKYMTGIVRRRGQKLIAINGMSDHVHVLIGMKSEIALSDLVRDIKAASSAFINDKRWIAGRFSWQKGFGAFSYSHSDIDGLVRYIYGQESHHRYRTFSEEYHKLLTDFAVQYDQKYLFNWISDESNTSKAAPKELSE